MKRFSFKPTRWFRRKPKTVYVVCPSCQRQAMSRDGESPTSVPSSGATADPGRQLVAQQAVDGLTEVNAIRRRRSTGDPLRDQALADIQAGFAQNVVDVARRLRPPGRPGDQQ